MSRVGDENGAYWRAKKKFDRDIILWALSLCDCNLTEAAEHLGLSYGGMRAIMARSGLEMDSLAETVAQENARVIADLKATGQLPEDWEDAPTKEDSPYAKKGRGRPKGAKNRPKLPDILEGKDSAEPGLAGKLLGPEGKKAPHYNSGQGTDFDLEQTFPPENGDAEA